MSLPPGPSALPVPGPASLRFWPGADDLGLGVRILGNPIAEPAPLLLLLGAGAFALLAARRRT